MALSLDDLRFIRASLCHTFDKRFGMPPAHKLAEALTNLETEIERLQNLADTMQKLREDDDGYNVVPINLARIKGSLD